MKSENTKTIATIISWPNSNPKLKYRSGKKTLTSLPNIAFNRKEKPMP